MTLADLTPMLACTVDLSKLRYPVIICPKMDGIRYFIWDNVVYGRSKKPIPNQRIQTHFAQRPQGEEGEIVTNNGRCTSSQVASIALSKDTLIQGIRLLPFDNLLRSPSNWWSESLNVDFDPLFAHNQDELLKLHAHHLKDGFEGSILRAPKARYKHGRASMIGQELMKLKPSADAEATVIGFTRLVDTAGQTHQLLGSLTCTGLTTPFTDVTFSVGTGLSLAQRKQYLAQGKQLIGKIVKFSYTDYGIKDAPRHPVFIGFRDPLDMD